MAKFQWSSILSFLGGSKPWIARAITLVAVVIIAIPIVDSVFSSAAVIRPFQVDPDLTDLGITGEVAATWLQDHTTEIQTIAETRKLQREFRSAAELANLDIEIEPIGLSVRSLAESLKNVAGRPSTTITGEITQGADDEALWIHVRVNGYRASPPIPTSPETLYRDLRSAAEHVYLALDPATLAIYYIRLNDLQAARRIAEDCLESCDKESVKWANLALANIAFNTRDFVHAETLYKVLLKQDSDFVLARVNLGMVYFNQRRYTDAIAEFEQISDNLYFAQIEKDSDSLYLANFRWAQTLVQLGKDEEALKKFDALRVAEPYLPHGYFGRAITLQTREDADPQEIEQLLRTAVTFQPDFLDTYEPLAMLLAKTGEKNDDALAVFAEAIVQEPGSTYFYHSYANSSLVTTVKPEHAREVVVNRLIEQGLDVTQAKSIGDYFMGIIYHSLDSTETASVHFKLAATDLQDSHPRLALHANQLLIDLAAAVASGTADAGDDTPNVGQDSTAQTMASITGTLTFTDSATILEIEALAHTSAFEGEFSLVPNSLAEIDGITAGTPTDADELAPEILVSEIFR